MPLPVDLSGIRLDARQGLARQFYEGLRERIPRCRLQSGTRLPASRGLTAVLRISPNTVARALDQLYGLARERELIAAADEAGSSPGSAATGGGGRSACG